MASLVDSEASGAACIYTWMVLTATRNSGCQATHGERPRPNLRPVLCAEIIRGAGGHRNNTSEHGDPCDGALSVQALVPSRPSSNVQHPLTPPTPFHIYVTPLSGLLNDYMPLLAAPLHYLLVSVGGLGWGNPAEEVKEGSGPQ